MFRLFCSNLTRQGGKKPFNVTFKKDRGKTMKFANNNVDSSDVIKDDFSHVPVSAAEKTLSPTEIKFVESFDDPQHGINETFSLKK